jgi:UDP-sugar transporter A1/2/3
MPSPRNMSKSPSAATPDPAVSSSGGNITPRSSSTRSEFIRRTRSVEDNNAQISTDDDDQDHEKDHRRTYKFQWCMSSVRLMVLVVLSLQNSLFTVLRRYSQGILHENYSKYECLLLGEVMKMAVSAFMIRSELLDGANNNNNSNETEDLILRHRLVRLVQTSQKMVGLALIYGAMNILSFVALRNIGAGMFTIIAQMKIMTTATFSAIILQRSYSWTKWRSLVSLLFGVLLFSEPIWGNSSNFLSSDQDASPFLGTVAVLIEVSLSGL